MKVSIKYLNQYDTSIFKELKKDYEVYINAYGFPVIEIMDTEIPLFGFNHQTFDIQYKVKGEYEKLVSSDRNGNYKISIEITGTKDTFEEISKILDIKRKKDEKKRKEEENIAKQKKIEAIKLAKEQKKKELEELESIESEVEQID